MRRRAESFDLPRTQQVSHPSETSITQWLERVKQGPDDSAAQHLWERYCQRLAAVAKKRFMALGAPCRAEDEADAVQEAFTAFFRRVQQGAYPDCRDRNDLWCLLVKIANNKARQLARGERRQKRGGGNVRGDSVMMGSDSSRGDGFDRLAGAAGELPLAEPTVEEPDGAFVDQLVDTFVLCYGALDEMERKILRGQLQGYTHDEIAKQIGCVTRTVERKLKVIRSRWQKS
jgi:RNA polymerase sigma factor (sigma-70 family)